MKVQLLLNPIPFSELPPNSIALDGAVRGTHLDFENNRWSFDHHAKDQPSIATRSSSMQVLLALRAGLSLSEIEQVFVSSIDADSVFSTAMVLNPELAANRDFITAVVMHLDTVDSLGPCGALNDKTMAFHYSLKTKYQQALTTELLLQKVGLFVSLVEEGRLFAESAPQKQRCTLVSISNNGDALKTQEGNFSSFDIYASSNIGVLYSPEKVTVGIKSSFVSNKNMARDGLFDLFDAAEIEAGAPVDENGKLIDRWGGKDSVGGSPFGASTLLSVDEVTNIFCSWLKS